MELYIIEDYRDCFPELTGRELTDALVIRLLTENGYLRAAKPRIIRLPGGKPVLAGDTGIFFSVSHTGKVFACAVSDEEIGLDIQEARRRDASRTRRLARRYFTEDEIAYLEGGFGNSGRTEEELTDRFYRLWTRKEAYAKYTGEGLKAVLEGSPVLGREDVVFREILLGDGLYGCICCAYPGRE